MEKLTIMARQDGDADLKEKDRSRRPELFDEVKFEGILWILTKRKIIVSGSSSHF